MLHCDPAYVFFERQSDLSGGDDACPDRWVLGEDAWGSLEEAAAARGCSLDCVWRAATAVMFLHCDRRDEYVSWAAEDAECPTLLQFSNGQFYDSIDDYDARNPCP